MTVPSNWYRDFFSGVALDLWRKAIPPEQSKAEADFLVKALQCEAGSDLLDVPCGNGRLSLELAQRGYQVTGVDLSEEFIEEARTRLNPPADAGGTDSARQVEFILWDMSKLEGEAIYDGAFCFGNSFGYLEYADMEGFLNGVARALKPGARFVVETGMAAESILPNLEARTWYQIEDILMTVDHRYQADQSCVDTDYTFVQDGKSETRSAKHWVYTVGEIRRMLERAGFTVLDLYGSVDWQPYKLGAGDLVIVTQKKSAQTLFKGQISTAIDSA